MTCVEQRRGFSRVDFAVALVMATVFLGFLIPAVYTTQLAGNGKETQNKLRQMIIALHNFDDAYKRLPPAFGKAGNVGRLNASLHIHLLPFVEPQPDDQFFDKHPLYQKYRLAEGKVVPPVVVAAYFSGQDPSRGKIKGEGIQNFPANLRLFADRGVSTPHDKDMPALNAMEPASGRLIYIVTDGIANTIAFGTKYAYCTDDGGSRYASTPDSKTAAFFGQNAARKKADPADPAATFQLRPDGKQCLCNPLMAQSFTGTGLDVAMADGSVRVVSFNVSPKTWNAAMKPNDGEPLGSDW